MNFQVSLSGIYPGVKSYRGLAAWTLKHGHFLIMGGFQLVEAVEGNSASPEASTGTEQVAPDDVTNIQPTAANTLSAEGPNADTEKGLAPLEEGY